MSEMLAAAKKRSKKSSSGSSATPPEPASSSSAKQTPDRELLESANQVLVLRNEKMKEQIVRTMIGNDDEEKVFLGDWKNTMKVPLSTLPLPYPSSLITLPQVPLAILQWRISITVHSCHFLPTIINLSHTTLPYQSLPTIHS